jgi:hypothetical protein
MKSRTIQGTTPWQRWRKRWRRSALLFLLRPIRRYPHQGLPPSTLYISRTTSTPEQFDGVHYAFEITGPAMPPGALWLGTTPRCGEAIAQSLAIAYRAGFNEAGKRKNV